MHPLFILGTFFAAELQRTKAARKEAWEASDVSE
jgi:hypothetical protein